MLFSNALFIAIASTVVSANAEVQVPGNWGIVEARDESAGLNKLFARLAKRLPKALDSSKVPPGVTYTYTDPSTTITITGGVTYTTVNPIVTTDDNGGRETSTKVIATSCDDFGSCTTTTLMVAINTAN